ncbi:MAG: glycosyltransferase family 87 protein [Candidatus Sumerlaeota bacterium]|nr:glycosyltransferase family 87 protein [Candidatus Sumerlaeota bacterium]
MDCAKKNSIWKRRVLAGVCLLILAVSFTIYGYRRQSKSPDGDTGVQRDFTRYSLAAARILCKGESPYQYSSKKYRGTFKYFPFNAILLAPLAPLPNPVAQGLWVALNAGLLLWCFSLHSQAARAITRPPWWVWLIALALAGRFILANLRLGQWNTSVYCLAFGGIFLARRRPWLGGATVGLAAAIKYLPAIFILYFLLRRQWKAAAGAALAFAFWVLVLPSVVIGPARHWQMLQEYRAQANEAYHDMTKDQSVIGYSLRSSLFAYLTPAKIWVGQEGDETNAVTVNVADLPPRVAKNVVLIFLTFLVTALVFLSAWTALRLPTERTDLWLLEAGLWFLMFLMVTPEARKSHFLTIFTAAFALAVQIASPQASRATKRLALGALGLAGLAILLGSEIINDTKYPNFFVAHGVFALALLTLAGASYAILWQAAAAPRVGKEAALE